MSAIKDTMLFVIALLDVCFAKLQTNEYIRNDTLSDRTCSESDLLFTANQTNKIKCSLFCETDTQCSGFTFRSADGECSGCQNGPGSLTTVMAGMEYFQTKPRCSTYGDTFQKYIGYRIDGNNMLNKRPCSLSRCEDLCRARDVCVSFDYIYDLNGDPVCNLSKVSALDRPSEYSENSGWEYHQRNCA